MNFGAAARPVVMGSHGMVSSGHYLASLAGVRVLQDGGNAVDAALATSLALTVVTPETSGPGGDLFALVYMRKGDKVEALNASGPAPKKATIDFFREQGLARIPSDGPLSIAVPGAIDGWMELHGRFGSLEMVRLAADAIALARDGFPLYRRRLRRRGSNLSQASRRYTSRQEGRAEGSGAHVGADRKKRPGCLLRRGIGRAPVRGGGKRGRYPGRGRSPRKTCGVARAADHHLQGLPVIRATSGLAGLSGARDAQHHRGLSARKNGAGRSHPRHGRGQKARLRGSHQPPRRSPLRRPSNRPPDLQGARAQEEGAHCLRRGAPRPSGGAVRQRHHLSVRGGPRRQRGLSDPEHLCPLRLAPGCGRHGDDDEQPAVQLCPGFRQSQRLEARQETRPYAELVHGIQGARVPGRRGNARQRRPAAEQCSDSPQSPRPRHGSAVCHRGASLEPYARNAAPRQPASGAQPGRGFSRGGGRGAQGERAQGKDGGALVLRRGPGDRQGAFERYLDGRGGPPARGLRHRVVRGAKEEI
ncbi:MAG: gamma-glutamyltransferase [Deltaproteobacteria bacterium]|nr:gamma-glutamyltransferase [Deltaproteobacteria bacterium]